MPEPGQKKLLLIEMGATHTRCATATGTQPPRHVAMLPNADHAGAESVIAACLDTLPGPRPTRAALAVAADVDARPLRITNRGWTLDIAALQARFAWTQATIVNDFEALACAIPILASTDLVTVRTGTPQADATVAVIGPGTGLGVSGLVPGAAGGFPIRSAGGHVTLAAADPREAEVLARLRQTCGHVSAERVLSGPGLLAVYRVLGGEGAAVPGDVTRLAAAGEPRAQETRELFFRFLGSVCADLALTLGARGGVYLGGGILPALRAALLASDFAGRFVAKGRYASYLARVPVHLIVADTPALRGLARHPLLQRSEDEES